MKPIRKLPALLLAVLMLVTTVGLAGCSKKPTEHPPVTTGTSQTDAEPGSSTDAGTGDEAPKDLHAKDILGERDLSGQTITFFNRTGGNMWDIRSLYAEEILSEDINDAVFARNEQLKEDYGFTVNLIDSGATSYSKRLTQAILGGDYGFDVVTACGYDMAELAANAVLLDLTALDGLNLGSSWWNTTLNSQLSIGNALYYLSGDIICEDNMAVRCVFFNKGIADAIDHPAEELYTLATDREWTFEEMFSLAALAYVDTGDKKTERIGFIAQKVVAGNVLLTAAGVRLTEKNDSDVPVFNQSLPTDLVSAITGYITGNGVRIESDALNPFRNNRALFMTEVLGTVSKIRDWDVKAGILPLPLYQKGQESYNHFADGNCLNLLALPTGNGARRSNVIFMMEAMCIESDTTLNPAFYDKCLRGRYSSDPESRGMLTIILDSYFIEDANLYKRAWGSLQDDIISAIMESQSVTTVLEKYRDSLPAEIAKTVNRLSEIAKAQRY